MESPLQALLREVETQLADTPEFDELAQAAGRSLLGAPSAAAVLEILLQPGVQVRPPPLAADVPPLPACWALYHITHAAIYHSLSLLQGCVPDADHVASCKDRGAAAFRRGQFRQAVRRVMRLQAGALLMLFRWSAGYAVMHLEV